MRDSSTNYSIFNDLQIYVNARMELNDLYSDIGQKRRSAMAFRLSCENVIDFQRLMEHHLYSEESKKKDQETLDYYAGIPDKHNAYFASHMIAGKLCCIY